MREERGDGILEREGRDGSRLLAAGFGAYGAAFLAWTVAGGAPGGRALISDLAPIPVGALATFLILRAARTAGTPRLAAEAWRSLGLACLSYLVGDALWFVYEVVLKQPPSPSPASLFYLAYYPLFLFGLLRFPTVLEQPHRKLEFWLDATIVLLGGSLVVWYFVLGPAAAQASGSHLVSALSLAYPVADLVLVLGASVTVGSLHKHPARPAFVWIVVGLVLEFAGDLIQGGNALQGTAASGGIADGLFVAHWASYGIAALTFVRAGARAESALDVAEWSSINVFPYAATVVGFGVLAVAMSGHWSTDVGRLVVGVMALTALVLVRQAAAERANLGLLREQATQKSEARFRALVQNASDVIVVVDGARRVRYHTPSLGRILGHPTTDIQDRPIDPLIHPEDLPRGLALLGDAVRQSAVAGPADWRLLKADGSWRNMEVTILSLLHEPDIEGVVVTLRDVHERKSLEERLTHLAFHDSLTGLANRSLLADRLKHSLAWARREGRPVSLLFLDLDHFKAVNDGLGHSAGDQVLGEVARRLASELRTTDTAARLGGDEFACLLEDTGEKGALLVAERLVEALRQPIRLEGREASISASVGIAVSRGGSESPDEMVRNADVAMYEAKQAGRNRSLVFEAGQHAAVVERLGTEADLRHAVERGEMLLLYQPIVALETEAVVGAEALVRWDHPRRGRLGPGDFIRLAEEREIIVDIGRFVLGEACRRARGWTGAGASAYVSVNLSGRQLQDKGFVDIVRRALESSGLPASRLILEITETFSLLETPAVVSRLFDLQALGVRLAIDDFGTGYSSLGYLQTLPMGVLKIDRAFVAAQGPRAAPVLRGIVELGKAMALGLVAEGIETADQVAALRGLGCEHGQGFLFARPMEASAIDAVMAEGMVTDQARSEAKK